MKLMLLLSLYFKVALIALFTFFNCSPTFYANTFHSAGFKISDPIIVWYMLTKKAF